MRDRRELFLLVITLSAFFQMSTLLSSPRKKPSNSSAVTSSFALFCPGLLKFEASLENFLAEAQVAEPCIDLLSAVYLLYECLMKVFYF